MIDLPGRVLCLRHTRGLRALAAGLMLAWAAAPQAAAQPIPSLESGESSERPGADQPVSSTDLTSITALRDQTREEIAKIRAQLGREDVSAVGLAEKLQLLERLADLYASQIATLERTAELDARREAAAARGAAGPSSALATPPPYPLALLDALLDARDAHRQRTRALEQALEAARGNREAAKQRFDTSERNRRQARDASERAPDPGAKELAGALLRRAELESRIAAAERDLSAVELAAAEAELAAQRSDEEYLGRSIAWVRKRLAGDSAQLAEPMADLDRVEGEIARELDRSTRRMDAAERRLSVAEHRLQSTPSPDAALLAEVEARRREREALQHQVATYRAAAERLEKRRELWRRRLQSLTEAVDRDTVREWERELAADLAEQQRSRKILEARLSEVRQELSAARLAAETAAAQPDARWREARIQAIQEDERLYTWNAERASDWQRLATRTLGEFGERTARVGLLDRLRGLSQGLEQIWNVELVAVDDRPITFGKVVLAVLLFVLGYLVARLLSHVSGRFLLRHTLDAGAASAVQRLLFYVLIALFSLLALRSVHIPLTAFTVIGGALAIGVGFGSQNVVNNFISGLILMVERPIKVGDLVEVEGTEGSVEHIGPRSTRIRTFDNTHIVVPNSAFLESNVVNWTLSDDVVRSKIEVGVAYGSPTREVSRLLLRAVTEHGEILNRPEPSVRFVDFGDNALVFRLNFWLRSRNLLERRRVESDVRFRIDHLFHEAGVVIAFPQRDVHLDTLRPLEVRVLDAAASKESQ